MLQDIDDRRGPELATWHKDHAEFFRIMPTLHETGVLSSITTTFVRDGENPVFAVTMLVRNAQGGMDAHLGFAAMPCPDGDLALIAPLVPLGMPAGEIQWGRPVPNHPMLVDLEVSVSSKPGSLGKMPDGKEIRTRHIVVGPKPGAKIGVVAVIDKLDDDLAPEDGIHRRDKVLWGSGWYAHHGGASFLWVHRIRYDWDDLCAKKKKEAPFSPPLLRLIAHLDAKGALTTDRAQIGTGTFVGFGSWPLPEAVFDDKVNTYRSGPTSTASYTDNYQEGAPAQTLYGIFDSVESAKARMTEVKAKNTIFLTTEPAPGAATVKEPWIVPVRPVKNRSLECDRYL